MGPPVVGSQPMAAWERSVVRSANVEQIDDEDQRLARQPVPRARCSVRLGRRDGQLAPSTHVHAWNTVLPALNQAAQGKFDRLAPVPRAVELLARVVLDADVVHRDGAAGDRFGAVANYYVLDHQLSGCRTVGEFDLGFLVARHAQHRSRADWSGGQGP